MENKNCWCIAETTEVPGMKMKLEMLDRFLTVGRAMVKEKQGRRSWRIEEDEGIDSFWLKRFKYGVFLTQLTKYAGILWV